MPKNLTTGRERAQPASFVDVDSTLAGVRQVSVCEG